MLRISLTVQLFFTTLIVSYSSQAVSLDKSTYFNDLNPKAVIDPTKFLPDPADIGGEDSRYGQSIAIDGEWAFIGAPNMATSGRVYVMRFDGTEWQEYALIQSSDGVYEDFFGSSVSVLGNRALVGAAGNDNIFEDDGAVYVFEFNGSDWLEKDKLVASDAAYLAQMGFSVALSTDRAVIGATGDYENNFSSGSVYVYDFTGNNWVETQILKASDQSSRDQFGRTVSIIDNRILIGAIGQDTFGFNSGSSYVFELLANTWTESQILNAPSSTSGDLFGYSLSQTTSRMVIGSPGHNSFNTGAGSVFIYEFDGSDWILEDQLIGSDAFNNDRFGTAVSLIGDQLWVGALGDFDQNNFTMSAYLFNHNAADWVESQLIMEGFPFATQFGSVLTGDADTTMFGAWSDNEQGVGAGAVLVYEEDMGDWVEADKLLPNEGAAYDNFGQAVSIDGFRAMVGAWQDDDLGYQAGAVYSYEFNGNDWVFQQKLLAPDGNGFDYFGNAVSLDGNLALIGAKGTSDAYVFEFINDSWVITQQLGSLKTGGGVEFGTAVSLENNRAVVTSVESFNPPKNGNVHVFELNGNWQETASFGSVNDSFGGSFGEAISVSGDRIMVGAFRDDGPTNNSTFSGAAYVFDLNGEQWSETIKLFPSDGASADYFGYAVALDGDQALVGAFGNNSGSNSVNSGALYAYELQAGDWEETQIIRANDDSLFKHFGNSVSMLNGKALIGARQDDANAVGSGAVYLLSYKDGVWNQSQKIRPTDFEVGGLFGWSVSLTVDWLVIGANRYNDHGTWSGSAYIYIIDDDLIFKQGFETN